MNNPFFAAANLILELHTKRAEYSKPEHATAEVYWLSEKLNDIASIARCVGDHDAGSTIADAAKYWKQYGKKPALFAEGKTA